MDQKVLYTNEVYNRYHNGITSLTDQNLEVLRKSHSRKNNIHGPTNYDVLSNRNYHKKFNYINFNQRYETSDFEFSDICAKFLNFKDKVHRFTLEQISERSMSEIIKLSQDE
jgi:hypothetical protein